MMRIKMMIMRMMIIIIILMIMMIIIIIMLQMAIMMRMMITIIKFCVNNYTKTSHTSSSTMMTLTLSGKLVVGR